MIADEVGEFLKFFDNVGYQLACLLDIDGQNGAKRSYNRPKVSLTSKPRGGVRRNKANSNSNEKNNNNLPNNVTGTSKRPPQRAAKVQQSSVTRRGKGKSKVEKVEELEKQQQQQQQQQQHDTDTHQNDTTTIIINDIDQTLLEQQHHQACDIQSHNKQLPDTQVLDGPLTLGIVDELQPLDPHGSSISPGTHLSPIDPSIQFTTSMHQQHYYPNQRGHIDSYQLHDEFASSHETIPITNSSSQLHQHQEHRQTRLNHQHLMGHQQLTGLRADSLDANGSTLTSLDCYSSNQNLHHHHHHHHHHQQHHHQQQQQPHHVQYHQLDQQWLGSTTHTADTTLQLGTPDTGPLDHVVPLSPATHQSLDQVQFSTSLYHHGGYYNHQAEHLDSFQNINDEYANVNTDPLTGNSSSPLVNLRLQESTQSAQQQQQQTHLHHSGQIRSVSINGNEAGDDGYSSQHHLNQPAQQHHHHHHQPHHSHGSQVHHAQPEHQMQNIDAPYAGHLNHHHHQHHHSQHQVMPLIGGLVEPAGVIIQDINLASASWSSPEDLYSI